MLFYLIIFFLEKKTLDNFEQQMMDAFHRVDEFIQNLSGMKIMAYYTGTLFGGIRKVHTRNISSGVPEP